MTDNFFFFPLPIHKWCKETKDITEQNASTGALGTLSLSRPLFRNTYCMDPICTAFIIGYTLSIRVKNRDLGNR